MDKCVAIKAIEFNILAYKDMQQNHTCDSVSIGQQQLTTMFEKNPLADLRREYPNFNDHQLQLILAHER